MKKRWTALLLAGSFFCCGCAGGRVRRGAVIGGVEVGGMTYAAAEHAVREKIAASVPDFVVCTPAGDFSFPLGFSDDVSALVRGAARGARLEPAVAYAFPDAEEALSKVCAAVAREGTDASVSFGADGFMYTAEKDGVACDYRGLLSDTLGALARGELESTLRCYPVPPAVTEEVLRARTRELASFFTVYDAENAPRSHNIALAAARIDGTTLAPGEEFSFNRTVGRRTRENGFEEAAVIRDGEFVQGVGGGVCQASTTLMNAALLAGLTVTESRPHSLLVGYVPPSRDAMVSESSDLKFFNPHPFPVYLSAKTGEGRVSFTVYGAPDGRRYEIVSEVLETLAPPPARIVEGSADRVVKREREGTRSESRLRVYEGERLSEERLLRRDTYAAVQGVYERASQPPADDFSGAEAENGANF